MICLRRFADVTATPTMPLCWRFMRQHDVHAACVSKPFNLA